MFNRIVAVSLLALVFLAAGFVAHAEQRLPNDAAALAGAAHGKAVFDVRTSDPKSLLFILKVIEETEKGMAGQGVRPEFVLSFRGGTLPLLRAEPKDVDAASRAILSEVRERLTELRNRGMTLEACNVAATMFDMEEKELADDVRLIGNSLISLIGYQNKGYALVPMY